MLRLPTAEACGQRARVYLKGVVPGRSTVHPADGPHLCLNGHHKLNSVCYLERQRNMKLRGEEVGGISMIKLYILFKLPNNKNNVLKTETPLHRAET